MRIAGSEQIHDHHIRDTNLAHIALWKHFEKEVFDIPTFRMAIPGMLFRSTDRAAMVLR